MVYIDPSLSSAFVLKKEQHSTINGTLVTAKTHPLVEDEKLQKEENAIVTKFSISC